MTTKNEVNHLDISKMSVEDIIEAIEFLDLICSHALMTVSDYGELGGMDKANSTKHHICVDFSVWLNTACLIKDNKKRLEHIERIERFIDFIHKHAYRVEPLSDEEFRAILMPVLEKLKEIEKNDK